MTTQDSARLGLTAEATQPDLVIAYLRYALKDVRALSPRSTLLLESAIAALIEETQAAESAQRRLRARSLLC